MPGPHSQHKGPAKGGLALGVASHLLRVAVGESTAGPSRKAAQGEIAGLMKETVSGTAVAAHCARPGHGIDLARLTTAVPQSAPGADGPCSSSGAQGAELVHRSRHSCH